MAFDENDERKAARATRGRVWRDIVMVVKVVRCEATASCCVLF